MPYQPFILKYRPRSFADVVGQEHVSRTLRNALASGRLVHAYLFTGPRGTGKTTMARILARALNCVNGPTADPCGVCDQCVSIIEGRSMDIIEIDAASNRGIDDIRQLRDSVQYAPSQSRHKLYILDECHMLTTEANNALLKTLEEPPAHAYFALLTTEVHKILPTILSRCQRFDFRPVSAPDTMQMLRRIAEAEGLTVREEALAAIAQAAEGGMRDAESIFEQIVAFSDGEITLELTNQVLGVTDAEALLQIAEIVARQDLPAVFQIVDRLVTEGKNLGRLIEDLTIFFRDLLRLALTGGGGAVWLQLGPEGEQRMRQAAQGIGSERLLAAVHSLAELTVKLKDSAQHALLLELALTELANPAAPAPKAAPRPAPQAPASQAPISGPPPTVMPAPNVPTRVPPIQAEAQGQPMPAAAAPEGAMNRAATPAQPIPSDGPLTPEIVWSHWERVLEQLRVNVRAFLVDAVPTTVQGERLTLTFPAKCRWHAGHLKSHSEPIQQALQQVFSRALVVEACVAPTDQIVPPTATSAAVPASDDVLAKTMEPPVEVAAPPMEAEASPSETDMPPAEDFALQSGQAPEPSPGMSTDAAVAQTMSLFPGSQEVQAAGQNPQ